MGNREVPKFLLDIKFMRWSVWFITIFSFVFMAVYSPFSSTAWFSFSNPKPLFTMIGFYILAVSLLFASKSLMNVVQKRIVITRRRYILWLVAEIVLIAMIYMVVTTTFSFSDTQSFLIVLPRAFICVTLILAIPYTIALLCAILKNQREQLEMIKYYNAMRANGGVADSQLINLHDNNGVLKLSVSIDSLYYAESQDNYVKIYYEGDGKLNTYMLRCKTKTIEESFVGTPLMRCHRSYIVNTLKIDVLKNERKSTFVVLSNPKIKPIPVSKSYYESIVGAISNDAQVAK